MTEHIKFNRMELAGSLGDLGTILPLAIGMILINGLNPTGLIMGVALFYIFSGLYFKVTSPVEPMKVIGAYAVATGITASQIQASCLWIFLFLIIIGGTGIITLAGRYIPRPVIRGVQLSTGVLLVSQGVRLMLGTSKFQTLSQSAEPYLSVQKMGWLPIGVIIGLVLGLLTLLLLENRRLPAALVVVGAGSLVGILLGTRQGLVQMQIGIYLPKLLPYGIPSGMDFSFALLVLVLPQIPMTLGNAVIANADLSLQYFPKDGGRVTYRALCTHRVEQPPRLGLTPRLPHHVRPRALHQHGVGQSAEFFPGRYAHVPRRRRAGLPLSLRCPHCRVKSHHRDHLFDDGAFSRISFPGDHLHAAHGGAGRFVDICRSPAHVDPAGHADPQRPVRAHSCSGHYPGCEPGGRFSDRHRRGLPFKMETAFHIIKPLWKIECSAIQTVLLKSKNSALPKLLAA